MGYYPEKMEELVTGNDPMWHGPYIKEIPMDPWRVSYSYTRPSLTQFELKSFGADGKPGGEKEAADIVY
jgi:general secretion pathway protein G